MSNCPCIKNYTSTNLKETNTELLRQTEDQTCPTVAYQPATVCVPVTVKPYAIPGATTTFCCGDPIITAGSSTCGGIVNGQCTFTITQNICVAVPIEFGATTTVGAPSVQCGVATNEDVCTNCGE
jgi:hypothetical protein